MDGPFAETKEQIAGYCVLDCADLAEAIEVSSRHPTVRYGTFELRPYCGLSQLPPCASMEVAIESAANRRTSWIWG